MYTMDYDETGGRLGSDIQENYSLPLKKRAFVGYVDQNENDSQSYGYGSNSNWQYTMTSPDQSNAYTFHSNDNSTSPVYDTQEAALDLTKRPSSNATSEAMFDTYCAIPRYSVPMLDYIPIPNVNVPTSVSETTSSEYLSNQLPELSGEVIEELEDFIRKKVHNLSTHRK